MAYGKYLTAGIGIGAVYVALPVEERNSAQTFEQASRSAIELLETKSRVVNGTGMGSLNIESSGRETGALLISVTRAGEPRGVNCRVTVTPVSQHQSSAEVDCNQVHAGNKEMSRIGADALTIVVREHVAATIDNRPYDIDSVANKMIGLAMKNASVMASALAPPSPKDQSATH